MKQKIKIYRMSLSKTFPATHPRKGQDTFFAEKIMNRLTFIRHRYVFDDQGDGILEKRHTLRKNFPLWKARIDEVKAGRAVLVLYEWNEKPFGKEGSRGVFIFGTSAVEDFVNELMKKEKYADALPVNGSGIGVQELNWCTEITASVTPSAYEGFPLGMAVNIDELAENDGLLTEDFKAWFKGYDLSKPMAIIHFTKFRY